MRRVVMDPTVTAVAFETSKPYAESPEQEEFSRMHTHTNARGLCLLAAVGLLAATTMVNAHHSFGAEYDETKPVTLKGTITEIEWTNPHTYLFMDVIDSQGRKANWKWEGYPPGVLYRTGWSRTTLKPGDMVTIFGWRARDGSNWAHSREVTLADGKKLFAGPPAGTGGGGPSAASSSAR